MIVWVSVILNSQIIHVVGMDRLTLKTDLVC